MLEHNQDHCCDANYIGVEIAESFFENLDNSNAQSKAESHPPNIIIFLWLINLP